MKSLVLGVCGAWLAVACTSATTHDTATNSALPAVTALVSPSMALPSEPPTLQATPSVTAETPSQTPSQAAHDGVLPAIARLPFDERVHVVAFASAAEGVWVASRLPDTIFANPSAPGGVLGDQSGENGKTWVQASEYGEVLLLNQERTAILRAYPLPGEPPQKLVVGDLAVYAERHGDGGLPDSMLARIDRLNGAWKARIFPSPSTPWKNRYLPPNWQVNAVFGKALFETIRMDGEKLSVRGADGAAQVDSNTLELADIVAADPAKLALADKVRAYLQGNEAFTRVLKSVFADGRIMCGVHIWTTSAAKHEIYATASCGEYGGVNGVATMISGIQTPVVLTTVGSPTTTAITAYKVVGDGSEFGDNVRAWFPASVVNDVLRDQPDVDQDGQDLFASAQQLLDEGELPSFIPANG